MNRAQKRKFKQQIKKARKFSPNLNLSINNAHKMVDRTDLSISEGTKVKFNIQKMKKHPDWEKLTQDYRDFVEQNSDKIFTVEYDEQYQYEPLWVCLAEDPAPIKWLFYIGDLQVVEEE